MPGFKELFEGSQLLTGSGSAIDASKLDGLDVVGVYFSAHWCPPCRGFTPQLAKVYKALKAQGKKFEIVFVSSDRDEAGFTGYFAEQPWLAVPFSARNVKKNLCDTFGIRGIPTLLLFDGKGNLVRSDGRSAVQNPAAFPWKP